MLFRGRHYPIYPNRCQYAFPRHRCACLIGVGLGLQNMAANVISGFTIIFGGKIRKGDWIEVEGMMEK